MNGSSPVGVSGWSDGMLSDASAWGPRVGHRRIPWANPSHMAGLRAWWKLIGWEPYDQQFQAHMSPARFITYVAGKRTGKSMWAARHVEPLIMTPQTRGWIIGTKYSRCVKEFDYLYTDLVRRLRFPMDEKHYNVRGGNMYLKTAWGSEVRCVSAKDPDNIEAEDLDWFILAEPAQHPVSSWHLARERVMDRRGIGLFPGTPPVGIHHWMRKLYRLGQTGRDPDYWSIRVSGEETPYPGLDEVLKLKTVVSDLRYRRDVLAEFVATEDIIYSEFEYGVHVRGDVGYRKDLPLYWSFDFGYTNPWVCLWIQWDKSQDRMYVVDEYAATGRSDATNIAAVKKQHKAAGYAKTDANFCDPSGAAPRAALKDAKVKTTIRGGRDVDNGIAAIREMLVVREDRKPGLMGAVECDGWADEMTIYHNKPGTDKVAKEDDHYPDALRYAVLNLAKPTSHRIRTL